MRTTGFSRSKAYRLFERGILPLQIFAGTRYIRSRDIGDFLRADKDTRGVPS
jgi:predicted DNA-binding transcriptional regulator AlpA